MNCFDHKAYNGETIGELLFSPAVLKDVVPRVIDVGARNGMFLLPDSYTRRSELIGFEPNPEEFKKLKSHNTDAEVAFKKEGIRLARFLKEKYFDCALWDQRCIKTFYVTSGTGACTLMGETRPFMKNVYYRYPEGDPRLGKSFYDVYSTVLEKIPVECRPLNDLISANEIVDFLKIDVEGGEIYVLKGASNLLDNNKVLFIQTEFSAFPYYEQHTLFGEQQTFLVERGFRLLDLNFDHFRYTRGYFDLPYDNDRAPLFAGDAFFMLDPDRIDLSAEEKHRLAAMLFIFGFNSIGLSLLHDAALLSQQELESIRKALQSKSLRSWQHRFVKWWSNLPFAAHRKVSAIKRLIHS